MSDEKYKASGYFANRGIQHFKSCVIDGQLDGQIAMGVYGLNERQLPLLEIELEAAGYLKKKDEALIAPRELAEGEMLETERTTAPLEPLVVDAGFEIDVAHEQ